jgi:isopropylmalate/homocitrate/citramalate synthase
MSDAKLAIETGVDGVDVVIGTSQLLREHSHGKTMAQIQESAIEVIKYIKRYVDSRHQWQRLFQFFTKTLPFEGCYQTIAHT